MNFAFVAHYESLSLTLSLFLFLVIRIFICMYEPESLADQQLQVGKCSYDWKAKINEENAKILFRSIR